jgi:hypothetical protein
MGAKNAGFRELVRPILSASHEVVDLPDLAVVAFQFRPRKQISHEALRGINELGSFCDVRLI